MPYTLKQLEAYVSSPAYDADTAGLLALSIPALKAATGQPGELLEPGVRRIRGNLCNVHGRYGPCDKTLSGKPKPKKGRAPKKPAKVPQTPAQRAQARSQTRQANIDDVAKRMAQTDTGLGPSGSRALSAFAQGQQPDGATGAAFVKGGLAEQNADGTYRMTSTGREVINAMAAGDYQRAMDGLGRASDTVGKRTERQTAAQARQEGARKRQQDAAGKRATAQVGRELAARQRAEQAKKKPGKAGGKPDKEAVEKPLKVRPTKRVARSSAPSVGSVGGAAPKPKPKPAPEKAPAKQIAPALQTAADQLSQGAEISEEDTQALIRNGLAKLNKDGELILTAAGMRATQKAFRVFKDAAGRDRWVAQSSTAYQDRDREIVSTKALSDDVARADADGVYGPLRWWHAPNLDLGQCDFNAMHGRVLIESGTFYSATIAQKVAKAAAGLEISLGFLHLPTEPDADGVFHHIRRFERSLVPRGKASNRFTAFRVKETIPMDLTKKEALKQLGFTDGDILDLEARASATEKAADDAQTAYKADEPLELPDLVINGVTYKAFPPAAAEEEVVEADAIGDMPMEEEAADPNALTLSAGDLAALTEVIQGAVATIMGGLDLEKKVAGHVQGLLAPFQQAQTTKDAEAAQTKEQLAALSTKVAELTGDQPNVPYRASAAKDTVINDAALLLTAKAAADPDSGDPWADIKRGLGLAQQ